MIAPPDSATTNPGSASATPASGRCEAVSSCSIPGRSPTLAARTLASADGLVMVCIESSIISTLGATIIRAAAAATRLRRDRKVRGLRCADKRRANPTRDFARDPIRVEACVYEERHRVRRVIDASELDGRLL